MPNALKRVMVCLSLSIGLLTGCRPKKIAGNYCEATKCGKVCRKGGFKAAKWALEDYLGTIASDAWSQFYDYSIRAQGDIERENRFGNAIFVMQNGNLLFDGHRNSYNYRQPAPFRATTPCPKSD